MVTTLSLGNETPLVFNLFLKHYQTTIVNLLFTSHLYAGCCVNMGFILGVLLTMKNSTSFELLSNNI